MGGSEKTRCCYLCISLLTAVSLIFSLPKGVSSQVGGEVTFDAFLSWSSSFSRSTIDRMREDGRVGGFFDTRILSTNRSYNYKLTATWLTPEVIRASARLSQFQNFLSDDETKHLVSEAEEAGDTVVLVEIDPREGSGVIPLDWVAMLRPKGPTADPQGLRARGVSMPQLRRLPALSGRLPRDYAYDRFWVVFPLTNEQGRPLFSASTREAELVIRIYEKEGRVTWNVPPSIIARASQ